MFDHENLILILLAAILVLLAVTLILVMTSGHRKDGRGMKEDLARLGEKMDGSSRNSQSQMAALRQEMNEAWRGGMQAQSKELARMSDRQSIALQEMAEKQTERMTSLEKQQYRVMQDILRENASQKEAIIKTLVDSIDKLQNSNEERLRDIQGVVDQKLDKTLNERLDANFAQVTEQLGNLYKSLGELKDLSGGVADLNRTLSNVKTRGSWGEMQLERILNETMSKSQYDVNVATKRNSNDRVEFAVKFPSQEIEGEWVYLPIDAKFPSDIYNKIADAAALGDKGALDTAVSELKNRIRQEASTIAGKYLDPPRTTNYAFMYLPTEGLYSEVLRIDGLSEECQKKGVIITGPTTITAVLNSLQVGFRNLTLSKKSLEVMKLLEAVKGQMKHLDDAVQKTQKKLNDAVGLTDDLKKRTGRLSSRMRNIGEMEMEESDRLLGMNETLMEMTTEEED